MIVVSDVPVEIVEFARREFGNGVIAGNNIVIDPRTVKLPQEKIKSFVSFVKMLFNIGKIIYDENDVFEKTTIMILKILFGWTDKGKYKYVKGMLLCCLDKVLYSMFGEFEPVYIFERIRLTNGNTAIPLVGITYDVRYGVYFVREYIEKVYNYFKNKFNGNRIIKVTKGNITLVLVYHEGKLKKIYMYTEFAVSGRVYTALIRQHSSRKDNIILINNFETSSNIIKVINESATSGFLRIENDCSLYSSNEKGEYYIIYFKKANKLVVIKYALSGQKSILRAVHVNIMGEPNVKSKIHGRKYFTMFLWYSDKVNYKKKFNKFTHNSKKYHIKEIISFTNIDNPGFFIALKIKCRNHEKPVFLYLPKSNVIIV